MRVKTIFMSFLICVSVSTPVVSYAAVLSSKQVDAVTALLKAFGVDSILIAHVESALGAATPLLADPPPVHIPTNDPVYPLGALGYDLSFGTKAYPVDPFGFAVVGVSGGRAFHDNARLASEYKWAQAFATRAAPTFYLNLNAPYGKTAITENVSGPRSCPTPFGVAVASQSAGGTFPDPTSCAGYNYGYHTAEHAYAYATSQHVSAKFWWLDIEVANSWSENTAVNDEVIQGAIDYLNSKGIRVGIYSMTFMWNGIAGKEFIPTQTINGKTVQIPVWFPIGIATRTQALNACNTKTGFIQGSPVWIIQYEENHTAIDQNIAC